MTLAKKIFVCAVVLTLLVGAIIILVSWRLTTVARLDAGQGVRILVVADTLWHIDPIRTYYYQVHRGESEVVSTYWIDASDSWLSFQLQKSTDGQLVALVERSHPDTVLAMFDISSSETWPSGADDEQDTSIHQRGLALLARLQQSHLDSRLILSSDGPPGPNAEL